MSQPQQNKTKNKVAAQVDRALRELVEHESQSNFEHRFFGPLYELARERGGYWGEIRLPNDELHQIAAIVALFTRLELDHEKVQGQCCPGCALPFLGQDTANCEDLENVEPGKRPEGGPLCLPVMLPCPGGQNHPYGDACLHQWFQIPGGSRSCPGCRHDFTRELSAILNEPPFPNGITDEYLLLFNLAVDRRVATGVPTQVDVFAHQDILPLQLSDLLGKDPFTLGSNFPGPQSAVQLSEAILEYANRCPPGGT